MPIVIKEIKVNTVVEKKTAVHEIVPDAQWKEQFKREILDQLRKEGFRGVKKGER